MKYFLTFEMEVSSTTKRSVKRKRRNAYEVGYLRTSNEAAAAAGSLSFEPMNKSDPTNATRSTLCLNTA
ncbi:hypothetical protein M0804_003397 [Polistes exclamans]|nr:hypothetical protein M0804_003397 [Polistes exclamans]